MDDFREIMLKLATRHQPARRPHYRESLGTQMLGTLSVSLGLVALMGGPEFWRGTWLLARQIYVWLYEPPGPKAPFVPLPEWTFSRYWGIALVGQFLGMIGVARSRQTEGNLSLLSVVGIIVCTMVLAPMYLLILACTVALGWPFLLAIAGAALALKLCLILWRR